MAAIWHNVANVSDIQLIISLPNFAPSNRGMGSLPSVGHQSPLSPKALFPLQTIVAATAYREPNYRVQLFLFGAVRLKYLALIVIGTDLLFITSNNAGGHIAHLGGALAGLWFAASLSKGKDVTYWINWFLDGFASLFQKKTWKRKPKMKVHYGSDTSREKDYDYNARKKAQSDEVDRILEKLKKSGYESLTTEEKKSLFDASKR